MPAAVGLILQARFASTRLRGKALAPVAGRPILERCLRRLMLARAGRVLLATTDRPEDAALAALARAMGVGVYRGSADDVLGRSLGAARTFALGVVIRATGDNPLVDIDAPGRLLRALTREGADYAWEEGLPYGGGVEAITVPALDRVAQLASDADDREHVTLFVRRHPEQFRTVRLDAPRPLYRPDLRVTVDTADDLARVRRLLAGTSCVEPSLADIITAADELARECAA